MASTVTKKNSACEGLAVVHAPRYLGIISKIADHPIWPFEHLHAEHEGQDRNHAAAFTRPETLRKDLSHDTHAASRDIIYFSRLCFIFYLFLHFQFVIALCIPFEASSHI